MRDSDTLGDAKKWLEQKIHEGGTRCPCCSRYTKVYKRQINSAMARSLIQMYKHSGLRFLHAPTFFAQLGGDFGKLSYWGLVREATEPREDGGRAGWWCVTKKGEAFIQQRIEVWKYALIYNATFLSFDGPLVSIQNCLGNHFNLVELMQQL